MAVPNTMIRLIAPKKISIARSTVEIMVHLMIITDLVTQLAAVASVSKPFVLIPLAEQKTICQRYSFIPFDSLYDPIDRLYT